MRKGFGLITAIVIMVTVSVLMTLMISLSNSSLKSTTDIFLKEQAELLARSSVEYALLAISGHGNSASCVEDINITYPNSSVPTHEANLSIYYFYNGAPASCDHVLENNIDTNESNITALIDVWVSVNQANTGITEPIVIHRRTIQKP